LRSLPTSIKSPGITLTTTQGHTATGKTLDAFSVTAMRDEINDQIASLRNTIRQSGGSKDAQKDLAKLQNSLDSLKRLEEERKNVSANIGGSPNIGEFKIS
jgi:hypothetical protein